ncbi:MAG TPA: PTS sugar transporter subunit IIA [Thermoanaerobaculia bacterium]|nr:PTS sugar transporter subunit IIA [Thermoanaerobaculia bacterium]
MIATLPLTELLDRGDIQLHFQAGSVAEAIPLLLRTALMRRVHDASVVSEIVDAAVKREQEISTMCGAVSLPHARSSKLDNFVLALGANAEGTIAGRRDPRLIFAFVSPEGKREQHLQLLASLARLSQNPKVVDQIAAASGADQVIEALRSAGV